MGREEHERVVRFRSARRDPELTVIEGFHALKHALRFGAELIEAVAVEPERLDALAADLAPDLGGRLADRVEPVDAETLSRLVPLVPRTGVVAIARRPAVDVAAALADPAPAPAVLLEQPRNMGNIGACIRVAAAAGAAAVLATGGNDPWHPDAVRGAAGLHYALPVAAVPALPPSDRPLLAVDPEGEELAPERLPPRAVLAFGTERHGLSSDLLGRAEARVAIPMREGVSSLNLATSVAVVLFAMR
jgi:TrmH family RNA methyltransferase